MFYETTLLLSPDIEAGAIETFWSQLMKKIQREGLVIEKMVKPYSRGLAYPIRKKRRAYIATFYVVPQKEVPSKIKMLLAEENDIMRFMVTTVKALPQEHAAMQPQQKRAVLAKTAQSTPARKRVKNIGEIKEVAKPSLEEIDKKLEEILEDKIGF